MRRRCFSVTDYTYGSASRLTDLDIDFAGTTNDQNIDFSCNPAGQVTQRTGSNDLYAFLDHWNMDAPPREGAQTKKSAKARN